MRQMLLDLIENPLPSDYMSFFEAWQQARIGDDLPLRIDIRLQQFASFAANMQIYELKSPSHLQCRLMGSEINNRINHLGMDDNIFDFADQNLRPAVEHWWGTMAQTPCGGLTEFSVGYESGINRRVTTLVLPMIGKRENILFLIYTGKLNYMDTGAPRSKLALAQDGYQAKFIDVGFGAPNTVLGAKL